jgi:EpsI family protein
MNRKFAASVILGVAMAGTSALTGALTPTQKVADARANFNLDTMIPKSFAGWTIDNSVVPLTPDPNQKELIAALYDQTLSRTYVNAQGQRVMLSIAYGGDQSKQLQLHLPEVCYVAQGFDLVKDRRDELATGYGKVPVKRLVARQNSRNEPITYWITIGDKAVKSGWDQRLTELKYGLTGHIADGMLVRISDLDRDPARAYALQDRFIKEMLQAMRPADRTRLIGVFAGA